MVANRNAYGRRAVLSLTSVAMASPFALPIRVFDAIPRGPRGMLLMLISAMCVVGMNVGVRQISDDVSVFLIAFWRHVFGVVLLLPFLPRLTVNPFRTKRLGLLTLRAILNFGAMVIYFIGLTLIPLADVTALGFTSPLVASVLAVLFLGETMGRRRIIGLLVGLVGALIILRPGMEGFRVESLLIITSTTLWACALITIKMLARTESSFTITLYAPLLQLPFALVAAALVWAWPTPEQWAYLLLIAVFGTVAQFSLSQAFRDADATLVLPVDFTKLIWASAAGFLFFAEIPDVWVLVGAVVVFSGVFYIATGERKKKAS